MTSRVLLTGATGFIGAHVAQALRARGDQVTLVDRLSPYYSPQLKIDRLSALCPSFALHRVDLADTGACADLFRRTRPDIVIHLAAQAGVRGSDHAAYTADNLCATANVLDGSREVGARVVMASSSSVYGDAQPPFREPETGAPLSLYAATKQGAEAMAQAYSHGHGLSVAALRFFTVFGPWGRPDMAPIRFARLILSGRPITVYGDGLQRRAFTHISDAVSGVLAAVDHAPSGFRAYNIGANNCDTVQSLICLLSSALDASPLVEYEQARAEDAPATEADTSRAQSELGWTPRAALAESVAELAYWCRDYYGPGNHGLGNGE